MTESLIVVPGFVNNDKLRELLYFCSKQTYILPPIRGKHLQRSPKATFVSTDEVGGHGDASEYLYNKRTPNGDMIVMTFDGNCSMKHRVPKEKGNNVVRYSIVIRTVKTKEEQGVDFEYNEQGEEEIDETVSM
eukprot:gene29237-33020_t